MTTVPANHRRLRLRAFGLTWLAYFSYYQCRTSIGAAKAWLIKYTSATSNQFALVETLYLIGYAVGQFIWGLGGDRKSPRKLLAFGLASTAALATIFGASDTVAVWAFAFGVNGFVQASGWPNTGRVMASWFSSQERGVVMGWWGTCYQLGPFVATAASGYLLLHYGWRWSLFGPALWTGAVALLIYVWLVDAPNDGTNEPDPDALAGRTRAAWADMLRRKTVWLLGANYFCIKLIRYSLMFWLPKYFMDIGYEKDGDYVYMPLGLTAGGALGVIVVGYVADRLFKGYRIATAAGLMILLSLAFLLYVSLGVTGFWPNVLWMAAIGALLYGPDSLVSGAAAQDAGGKDAAGLACGFVNGVGSIGAVLQGFLTAYVSHKHGWDSMFWLFMVFAFIGCLVLIPLLAVRPTKSS